MPVFATALKTAVAEAGEDEFAKVAFKTDKGYYVKKTEHVSDSGTTYHDNYVFGNVEVMEIKASQEDGASLDKAAPSDDDKGGDKPIGKSKPSM